MSCTKPRTANYPARPIPVVAGPTVPPLLVRTLIEAEFIAASPWACVNPYCQGERVIETGQPTVRTFEGEYLHAVCVASGWPNALVAASSADTEAPPVDTARAS